MGKRGPQAFELTDALFEQIKGVAGVFGTAVDAAGMLGISVDTLDRRLKDRGFKNWSEFYDQYSAAGRISLRRAQFKLAVQNGNAAMQIWLGKQELGQRDYSQMAPEVGGGQEETPALNIKITTAPARGEIKVTRDG